MKWPPSPNALLAYLAIIATLAALIGGVVAYKTAHENSKRIDDIEAVQTEACNGRNVLRQILRTQIQRQIDQSIALEQSGQYDQFFPNIPPEQLHKLLEEQRNDQRADKVKLANEDC
jgi:hypothetical protein